MYLSMVPKMQMLLKGNFCVWFGTYSLTQNQVLLNLRGIPDAYFKFNFLSMLAVTVLRHKHEDYLLNVDWSIP